MGIFQPHVFKVWAFFSHMFLKYGHFSASCFYIMGIFQPHILKLWAFFSLTHVLEIWAFFSLMFLNYENFSASCSYEKAGSYKKSGQVKSEVGLIVLRLQNYYSYTIPVY